MINQKRILPLNLQLFSEGGDPEPPKTYTQEEYDKLLQEVEKQKKEKDKYSKELSDFKKKEKEKLTEEEKLIEEQKLKDEELSNTKKELLTIKMSKELMTIGFDEKTITTILESYNKGDGVEFAKTLSTNILTLIENVRKEEQTKFQQSGVTPPNGGGKVTSGLDPVVERYINNRNSNKNVARQNLFGDK